MGSGADCAQHQPLVAVQQWHQRLEGRFQLGQWLMELNTTIVYPANSSNQCYVDWRASWNVTNFATPNPAIDGFFTDNVFWSPRVNGDWQQNGTSDSDTEHDGPSSGTGRDTSASSTI